MATKNSPKKSPTAKAPTPEMVEIVDKDDTILGTMTRAEAEAKGKRFRIVHVMLINDDDTMLVQWRKSTKSVSPRTFTASAAGAVEVGENYEDAAHRELKEELGISRKIKLKMMGSFQTKTANGQLFAGVFNGDIKGWEEEADAIDYLNRDEAEYLLKRYTYLLSPSFVQSLKLFLKATK
ncbi:MAG: NUDIX domain-containing protein [Blastochloris viridis]|uniref:NUDIX domain-containing protein n=1 Tax=Blastochloris viridis TaxID=1079 RepID=A0A6N4RES9_BLAVI|nr:MAG: NUDIX domain-containing protein [Blastochloris viridis]